MASMSETDEVTKVLRRLKAKEALALANLKIKYEENQKQIRAGLNWALHEAINDKGIAVAAISRDVFENDNGRATVYRRLQELEE